MGKCKRISRLIYKEADGIITDKEKKYLLKHIEDCKKCRVEYMLVTNILKELKEEENKPLPENFKSALREKLIEYNLNKESSIPFYKQKWINIAVTCCVALGIMSFALSGNIKDAKNSNSTEGTSDLVVASDTTNAPANLKMRAFSADTESAQMETPEVFIKDKDGSIKAVALRGTNSIKGETQVTTSDYPHPLDREYSEENTLEIKDKETFYTDNGKIDSIRVYSIKSRNEIKTHIQHTETSFTLNKDISGCIIELKITFDNGKGYYSIKI